jgi:hypothetical protein
LQDQSTILVFLAELLAASFTHFPSYPLMAVTGGGGAVDDDAMETLMRDHAGDRGRRGAIAVATTPPKASKLITARLAAMRRNLRT